MTIECSISTQSPVFLAPTIYLIVKEGGIHDPQNHFLRYLETMIHAEGVRYTRICNISVDPIMLSIQLII